MFLSMPKACYYYVSLLDNNFLFVASFTVSHHFSKFFDLYGPLPTHQSISNLVMRKSESQVGRETCPTRNRLFTSHAARSRALTILFSHIHTLFALGLGQHHSETRMCPVPVPPSVHVALESDNQPGGVGEVDGGHAKDGRKGDDVRGEGSGGDDVVLDKRLADQHQHVGGRDRRGRVDAERHQVQHDLLQMEPWMAQKHQNGQEHAELRLSDHSEMVLAQFAAAVVRLFEPALQTLEVHQGDGAPTPTRRQQIVDALPTVADAANQIAGHPRIRVQHGHPRGSFQITIRRDVG